MLAVAVEALGHDTAEALEALAAAAAAAGRRAGQPQYWASARPSVSASASACVSSERSTSARTRCAVAT